MATIMKNDKCSYCGKFFKWTEVHIYTPYGGYLDDEPPDDKIICKKCWGKFKKEDIALIEKIAWQKSW